MKLYHSSRGESIRATADEAILRGIAPDGGLYVPERLETLDLHALLGLEAYDLFARVLSSVLRDCAFEDMRVIVEAGYRGRFETGDVTPLVKAGDVHMLELFRGPTAAFKDIALSLLPRLITRAARRLGVRDEIRILTATSGDTGKAALAGFADVPGTSIAVFYPHGGVSEVQRRQMTIQPGENVRVCAVRGNFDDAQSAVKRMFADADLNARLNARGVRLSSANSINLGRLAPQVAYYFKAYFDLVRAGEIAIGDKVNFAVPTGNFGNILAGAYARQMGLPVGRLICASNENHVLTDFIRTGVYDSRRNFRVTASPSMDILISSNLERCLHLFSGDCGLVNDMMRSLAENGVYEAPDDLMKNMREWFCASWANDAAAADAIRRLHAETGYLMDTHTAVGYCAAETYRAQTGDTRPLVLLATASPFKFADDVLRALGIAPPDGLAALDRLSDATSVPVPQSLAELSHLPEIHKDVAELSELSRFVEEENL
ncbi:MAG: threonine synthase [Christensenellales bacterium]|jgi:threonine synthase